MSNLKKEVNDFIFYLRNLNIKEEDNFKSFIKDRLQDFSNQKNIIKVEKPVNECLFCKSCINCRNYGFPCINCASICYKTTLGEGYPLHIN